MSGSFEVPTLKHTDADPESQSKTIESVTIPKVQLKSAGGDPESQPKHIESVTIPKVQLKSAGGVDPETLPKTVESVTIPKVALKSARRPVDYDGSVANVNVNVSSNYEANKENPFGAVKLRGGNRPADFDGSIHNVVPKAVETATVPKVQLKSVANNVSPKVSESSTPIYDVSSLKPTTATTTAVTV